MILVRFLSHRTDQMSQPQLESTKRTFILWTLSLVDSFAPQDSRVLVDREDRGLIVVARSNVFQGTSLFPSHQRRWSRPLAGYLHLSSHTTQRRAGSFFEQTGTGVRGPKEVSPQCACAILLTLLSHAQPLPQIETRVSKREMPEELSLLLEKVEGEGAGVTIP